MKLFTLLIFLFLFKSYSFSQDTIHVPTDFSTIQSAIDTALNGDLVLVENGIYIENINFTGKAITVASYFILDVDTNHINNTVIDGSQPSKLDTASVVYFTSGEDTTSVLSGFTITGGTGTLTIEPGVETVRIGGGIYIDNSGAKIVNNKIINNSVEMDLPGIEVRIAAGGGIAAITTAPHTLIITNNYIANNSSSSITDGFGGGIIVSEEVIGAYDVIISGNEIVNNQASTSTVDFVSAGGGVIGLVGKISIVNNIVKFNTLSSPTVSVGGGIVLSETMPGGNSLIENNIVTNNSLLNGMGLGGGIDLHAAPSVTIRGNRVVNNQSNFGAGLFISVSNPLVQKNLIINNIAAEGGGGIWVEVSNINSNNITSENSGGENNYRIKGIPVSRIGYANINRTGLLVSQNMNQDNFPLVGEVLQISNNTIADNSVGGSFGGAGISTLGSTVRLENSIVWGNFSSGLPQIEGPVFASYSDVQGGYPGQGNIDEDPMFSDMLNYYLDETASPCIDSGNPDTSFNDPENPSNPGFALWPALGTVRNDIGAYGGNYINPIQTELLGPQFSAFVERVLSVPVPQREAIVDSFMNAVPSFPLIEENSIVYYLYEGAVGSVNVPGDANGWDSNLFPMTQLDGTMLWYREAVFEPDARLDYKFVLNGSNWILDPLNPNVVNGGFGPNSELAMPEYVQPPEIEFNPGIPHGNIDSFLFSSSILGNTRNIKVYTPPGYESAVNDNFPIILLHDGLEYISLAFTDNVLDNLIYENKILPVIAVFVPPVNRNDEYAFNQTAEFESFIIDELMPHIDTTYRTMSDPQYRAMGGISFGGLITTQITYNNPEQFGLSAPYSPSYWAKDMEVFNTVLNGQVENIKWYLDWGTYEVGIMVNARSLRDGLIDNGYEITWNEWHEGHSWGSWRAHLDIALEYFFPNPVSVEDEKYLPTEYVLSQNFPNPFNPRTRIIFQIPVVEKGNAPSVSLIVYDVLGKEVATLVNEAKPAGSYEIEFDATNIPSGVYFYQLRAGNFIKTKKMLLLK